MAKKKTLEGEIVKDIKEKFDPQDMSASEKRFIQIIEMIAKGETTRIDLDGWEDGQRHVSIWWKKDKKKKKSQRESVNMDINREDRDRFHMEDVPLLD